MDSAGERAPFARLGDAANAARFVAAPLQSEGRAPGTTAIEMPREHRRAVNESPAQRTWTTRNITLKFTVIHPCLPRPSARRPFAAADGFAFVKS